MPGGATRVSRASWQCRALGLGLTQAPVLLAVPVSAGTLRFPEGVAEMSMVPPHPELAPALVLASWTELVEVPQEDLPQQGLERPSASPVPEQARPWPFFGPLAGVRPSGGAPGSVVAPAGAGTAFGFAGAGVDAALAVASGFLPCVSSPLAGVRSSGETACSVVAVAPCSLVELEVAVDPGGHVIQHSAPAGNDRSVNPVATNSSVSSRDFAFMISPPFVSIFIHAHLSERVRLR